MTDVRAKMLGWVLDTHSTMLSRKMSYHLCIGKKRYVKLRKAGKSDGLLSRDAWLDAVA